MAQQDNGDAEALRRRVGRKLMIGLVVPIALITFVNSIDRVNVSYAGSAMSADLGLSPEQFGQGVSVFFIAYLLFQYPHVLLLRKIGIKAWLAISMSLWALSGFWMAHVTSPEEFYGARFLLGVAEAGFAPGMTWLISQWTPPSLRAGALSGALVAVPLSMVLGGPLCGWLLGLGNPLGIEPWRYMFLAIAVPNVILAALAAWHFVDRPTKARWLSPEEVSWLEREMSSPTNDQLPPAPSVREIARDPWLWRCSIGWLLIMTGAYALAFWLPQLVRRLDLGGSEFMIGTLSALPMLGVAIGLTINGRLSDRRGERLLHVAVPSAAAGIAMLVASSLQTEWLTLALLFVAGLGLGAAQGVFWAIPGAVGIGGERVPVGVIALISIFGTAGGIIGPMLVGALVGQDGNFSTAIAVLASLLVIAPFVIGYDRTGRTRAQPALAR